MLEPSPLVRRDVDEVAGFHLEHFILDVPESYVVRPGQWECLADFPDRRKVSVRLGL